ARNADCAAENVTEQNQQQRRLHGTDDQHQRRTPDAQQVALRHTDRVPGDEADGEPGGGLTVHCACPAAELPVRDRKTSSNEGCRMPKSTRATCSASSRCPTVRRNVVPPCVGTLTNNWSASTRGEVSDISARIVATRARSPGSATRASRVSPPSCSFRSH